MASVEVSTMGGEAHHVETFPPAHNDECDEESIVLSPVSAVEPSIPMNNDLRMYTKSVEQAESMEQLTKNASADVADEESIEIAKSTDRSVKSAKEEAPATAEEDKPTEASEEEPVKPALTEEEELAQKLAAPIPLHGSRSRSFQILPRGGNNKTKAYPFHRSLSFDSNKKKKGADANLVAAGGGGAAPTKNGSIPLLRRLSFRGRKEMKDQQEGRAPKAPISTPPKPPRPNTPLNKKIDTEFVSPEPPLVMSPINEK